MGTLLRMGTAPNAVHSPARDGPAGSDELLAGDPMLEAQGELTGSGREAYLFDFMHSFAIEFLHCKEERVELRERKREAVGNTGGCAPLHVPFWLGHGFG